MKDPAAHFIQQGEKALILQATRLILVGSTLATLGLALSLTEARTWSGWPFLLGLLLAATGLHKYGRSGSSPPLSSTRSKASSKSPKT